MFGDDNLHVGVTPIIKPGGPHHDLTGGGDGRGRVQPPLAHNDTTGAPVVALDVKARCCRRRCRRARVAAAALIIIITDE